MISGHQLGIYCGGVRTHRGGSEDDAANQRLHKEATPNCNRAKLPCCISVPAARGQTGSTTAVRTITQRNRQARARQGWPRRAAHEARSAKPRSTLEARAAGLRASPRLASAVERRPARLKGRERRFRPAHLAQPSCIRREKAARPRAQGAGSGMKWTPVLLPPDRSAASLVAGTRCTLGAAG